MNATYIGTAAWSLPTDAQWEFPGEGTHLVRYARRLTGVEINTSFYRAHRPATYTRWAASVPAGFRFAVKIPRTITHEHRLVRTEPLLDAFMNEVSALGAALGPLLVQLPPSLALEPDAARAFLAALRERASGSIVLEPRHASWFSDEGDALLRVFRASGVAADPARTPMAGAPWGDGSVVYYRLHGSPEMYRSPYDMPYLRRLAGALRARREEGAEVWCMFDNTALGAATINALALEGLMR